MWLIPSDGTARARQLTRGAGAQRLRWDGRTGDLIVSGRWGEERVVLRSVSARTGVSVPFQPLLDLGGRHSYGFFDISRDGKWLVYSRENVSGHVWLLKAGKPCF